MKALYPNEQSPGRQDGFSMVELMVALLIGLFLMGGLLTLVQDNKRTFTSQNQLAQLQDAERLALTMMTDVIQETGYFPDPTTNTAQSTMLASGQMAAGQALYGTYGAAAPGDTITVRFATNSGDGILNCTGSSNNTGAIASYINTFSVVVNAQGVSQLVCTREDGTAYPLVNGVENLSILYGVNTTGSGNNVDTYWNATQVNTAGDWNSVISAQITLTFNNPLYFTVTGQAVAGQPQYITLQRNVTLMSQTGL